MVWFLASLRRFRSVVATPLATLTLLVAGAAAMAQGAAKPQTQPASDKDIGLYIRMSVVYFCNARAIDIEFPKALGAAASAYAGVLQGRHGGFVAAAGNKKLTPKVLYENAEIQTLRGALSNCPDEVPADVKTKVEEALKKQSAAQ